MAQWGPKEGWSAMEVIDDGGCGAVGGNGVVLGGGGGGGGAVPLVGVQQYSECTGGCAVCSAVQCLLLLLALPEMG